MNILFISFDADPPHMGGTATVANILAKSFIANGHFCALGYMDDSEQPSLFFKHKVKLVEKARASAVQFFSEYHFDIILNQLPTSVDYIFLRSMPLGSCKIISAYHNKPVARRSLLENLLQIAGNSYRFWHKLYTLAKIPLLPLMSIKSEREEKIKLRNAGIYSDKLILLSEKFFPVWKKLVPDVDVSKLIAIGNPLVFEKSMPVEKLVNKEKLVIAVCAVTPQKRAHLILQIWKKIENDPIFEDWQFEFVGGGEGFNQIQSLAEKLKLRRARFVGFQKPYPYYERASIMLMTSKYEGWPMVLMEGQQMGVIPISYNSYESITDIITDGENGLIIPNNDMDCFVERMKTLMLDDQERKKIATKAILSSQRFTIDKIIDKYMNLFSAVMAQKSN